MFVFHTVPLGVSMGCLIGPCVEQVLYVILLYNIHCPSQDKEWSTIISQEQCVVQGYFGSV